MDISDGLIGDLAHICEMSKVGARLDVDSVPVARAAISAFGKEDARLMALTGGEDYELLFTAPRPVTEMAASSVDCPVTVIGEITDRYPGTVRLFNAAGKRVTLPQTGWDHFRPAVEE
jgi:thiamine-monophosphate kinase